MAAELMGILGNMGGHPVGGVGNPMEGTHAGAGGSRKIDAAFSGLLDEALGKVDSMQFNADHALQELSSGRSVDLHGTMIALEKADISLKSAVAVRDKFVQAYEQVMNMSI